MEELRDPANLDANQYASMGSSARPKNTFGCPRKSNTDEDPVPADIPRQVSGRLRYAEC
jgi:hypothetical protein